MIEPIFKKSDFSLCYVPVPKGYPQSQTHSGIIIHKGNYYLVTSPYPNVRYNKCVVYLRVAIRKISGGLLFNTPAPDYYENPCIYIGEHNNGNPPISFNIMAKRALMENPENLYDLPTFNSDPDISIDGEDIIVLNRAVYRTEIVKGGGYKAKIKLFLLRGRDDNKHFSLEECFVLKRGDKNIISPCLIRMKKKYLFVYLDTNSYNDGLTFNGLYYQIADSLKGLQSDDSIQRINVFSGDFLPWHMSLFEYKDRLYTIIACVKKGLKHRCWQLLGEFNANMTELFVYPIPLTDYSSYRSAACVTESGEFVLYNTTVHEKIRGSKAVDGRDIIMSHMPFDELLSVFHKANQK